MTVDEIENCTVTLDSKGICDILKVCARSGVRSFECGPVKIKFSYDPAEPFHMFPVKPMAEATESPGPEDSTLKNELDTENENLTHLMISNPYEYEQALLSGEIEPGDDIGH